ncbi:cell division protein FtsX [Lysinibacillus contaminans]|uniref:Cell division protein FtsX n=1 Tax=Lysinibacillus contaminans TaxID=1293441 RepID=A0ABR5JXM0_9BACI|nr:permease-like cell division protein FtsX [Lysinibacillus contaminans]KOS66697.1 cell division protein FtsX [Lysinibacillus contaminans]
MKFNTIKRHFRESFKSLGRNSWMTIASVSAVTVTLILVGVFALIMMNLNKAASDLENDVEIKVLIDETADETAEKALLAKIEKLPEVAEMTYSTKEEELTDLVKDFGDDFKLFEQSNPLRNVVYVKASDPQQTVNLAKKIDKFDFTYDVKYGEGKVEKLFSVLNISRNVGLVLILGLLFTAIFLISNTIRITIIARRDEIEIMKLVGASNSFVRIPFVLEGMWLGVLGSIIPIAVVITLYHNVYKNIAPRLQGEFIQLLEFSPLVYQVSGLLLLIGVLIGVWGSFMSVRKFLKI